MKVFILSMQMTKSEALGRCAAAGVPVLLPLSSNIEPIAHCDYLWRIKHCSAWSYPYVSSFIQLGDAQPYIGDGYKASHVNLMCN